MFGSAGPGDRHDPSSVLAAASLRAHAFVSLRQSERPHSRGRDPGNESLPAHVPVSASARQRHRRASPTVDAEAVMLTRNPYEPLRSETLPARLGTLPEMTGRPGAGRMAGRCARWATAISISVFIVESTIGSVRRQAGAALCAGRRRELADVARSRLLRISRADPARRARPGRLPELLSVRSRCQALQIMEHLSPHIILRRGLIAGTFYPALGAPSRTLSGAHLVPRLGPVDGHRAAQGGCRLVCRQCRAVRDHRGSLLHRSVLGLPAQPAYAGSCGARSRRSVPIAI